MPQEIINVKILHLPLKAKWCERIASMCCGRSLHDVHEMILEVSKTSYFEGVHAEREISAKFGGRKK